MNLTEAFLNPPATYRPQPFFVWNGDMTRERITEMMEQYAGMGCGGVFIHPRPGLITDYLSEDYFDLWGWTLSEAERLGIECHIYDENSYPSGFGGGHTVATNPHTTGASLEMRVVTESVSRKSKGGEKCLAAFRQTAEGRPGEAISPRELGNASVENPIIAFFSVPWPSSFWQAGFPYVDLLKPEATQTFLQVTHEQYRKRFGEAFGERIKFAFADEPTAGRGMPVSSYFLQQFRKDHGYDLLDRVQHLFFHDDTETSAVRFDYWSTVNRLFTQNYAKASADWCEASNLQFTGHYHESSWPAPRHQPSTMYALRWMQAPGNDLLGFQFFPTSLAENGIYYLNLKELSSIANQCGRERVVVETTGGGGYDFTIKDFKPLEDFCLVNGVNVINPHLSHTTLSGARKYDWPHTLSDHSPWWWLYKGHADHVGRVNAVLSQGREKNRVLVLHPDSSGWVLFDPSSSAPRKQLAPEIQAIQESQKGLIQQLNRAGIDFDLGDEFTLAELGEIADGKLRVGQGEYEAVIVPPGMINILGSTLDHLQGAIDAGVPVFVPSRIQTVFKEGRRDQRFTELQDAGRFVTFEDYDDLTAQLTLRVVPRVTNAADKELPANLCWRRVESAEGEVAWFFCNPFDAALDVDLHLADENLLFFDSLQKEAREVERSEDGAIALRLAPRGHALLAGAPAEVPEGFTVKIANPPRPVEKVDVEFRGAKNPDFNVLMLDYCDLETANTLHEDVNTIIADNHNWPQQGFPQNPWRVSIQYRKTFLEWPIDPESGFKARYRFTIDPDHFDEVENLAVCIERPWLYKIRLNDQELDPDYAARWFDMDTRALPVDGYTQPGENVLELECKPFHPLAEMMPVYVTGYFNLEPAEKGFVMRKPSRLTLGNWAEQGAPFYCRRCYYGFRFTLAHPAEHLWVKLPRLEASVARIKVDDHEADLVYTPFEHRFDAHFPAGDHRFWVLAIGNLKNMMGPHHTEGLPGGWSWELSPKHQPPGKDYRFYPTGLIYPPVVLRD